jgi:hypothetical protein
MGGAEGPTLQLEKGTSSCAKTRRLFPQRIKSGEKDIHISKSSLPPIEYTGIGRSKRQYVPLIFSGKSNTATQAVKLKSLFSSLRKLSV